MSTAEEDKEATRKSLGKDADNYEVFGGGAENGHFTGIRPKQSRQQRRLAERTPRLVVARIVVHFENGHQSEMDITKVNLIDRVTKQPLFDEVIEG